jgi:hypothetical protein
VSVDDMLYDEQDIARTMDKIEVPIDLLIDWTSGWYSVLLAVTNRFLLLGNSRP